MQLASPAKAIAPTDTEAIMEHIVEFLTGYYQHRICRIMLVYGQLAVSGGGILDNM